jgi:DNA topoisomerase-1
MSGSVPHSNGHIQAVGADEAGRRQYLSHDEWRTAQDAGKHDRVRRLARRPDVRAALERSAVRLLSDAG